MSLRITRNIVEPLQRIISPVPGFLEGLRELCNKNNIIIFDEIVTGFRLAYEVLGAAMGSCLIFAHLGKLLGVVSFSSLGCKKRDYETF